ncbi:DUF982 domain-containing protein [Phyllobacterium endophyticum]|uniref:DUF982 domain-containing protein n=1 Tax=Phyllobacterium endophyticum TaxID=1149773 RepID=A0A2P7AW39_9HYPH|nr:DUF982 domain-containing protein [Phyllobacterium endophyticum]MBB3235034.1 hypothetical protein [Phyllobacterium endophyticum]PSH58438.1 DUF982 domain-containing protein [Phyllobacterium endophyticum]TYR39113.1 DUF982 domain-containing protein [Phyllobacterium endophyticum]
MEEGPFKEVRIMTGQPGRMRVVTSALQAAEMILTDWPADDSEVLSATKHALLACLEGDLSPGAARFAFIQAAKEAGNYVDEPERGPPIGKPFRWHRSKSRRGA